MSNRAGGAESTRPDCVSLRGETRSLDGTLSHLTQYSHRQAPRVSPTSTRRRHGSQEPRSWMPVFALPLQPSEIMTSSHPPPSRDDHHKPHASMWDLHSGNRTRPLSRARQSATRTGTLTMLAARGVDETQFRLRRIVRGLCHSASPYSRWIIPIRRS